MSGSASTNIKASMQLGSHTNRAGGQAIRGVKLVAKRIHSSGKAILDNT